MPHDATYRTILIADDHDAHTRLVELLLSAHRYRVVPARSGHDALSLLQSVTPDAIVLDVTMPRMSGFDVARRIRRVRRLEGVPILFLTSNEDAATRAEAEAVGAAALLRKPLAGSGLRTTLSQLFGSAGC